VLLKKVTISIFLLQNCVLSLKLHSFNLRKWVEGECLLSVSRASVCTSSTCIWRRRCFKCIILIITSMHWNCLPLVSVVRPKGLRLFAFCLDFFFFFFFFVFVFFFLFLWHYSPWWTLASFKIVLHCSRSCALRLQFFTSIFLKSVSTYPSHLALGFQTCRVPSSLCNVNTLQGYSSCFLKRCPSHLNLPILITPTVRFTVQLTAPIIVSYSPDTALINWTIDSP
jgi:hypothetical protein